MDYESVESVDAEDSGYGALYGSTGTGSDTSLAGSEDERVRLSSIFSLCICIHHPAYLRARDTNDPSFCLFQAAAWDDLEMAPRNTKGRGRSEQRG